MPRRATITIIPARVFPAGAAPANGSAGSSDLAVVLARVVAVLGGGDGMFPATHHATKPNVNRRPVPASLCTRHLVLSSTVHHPVPLLFVHEVAHLDLPRDTTEWHRGARVQPLPEPFHSLLGIVGCRHPAAPGF